MTKNLLNLLAAAAIAASTAQGADVSWSAYNVTNSATDVSTTGTPVASKSGALTTNYTVNGVVFTQGQILDTTTHNDNISSRIPSTLEAAYKSLLQSGSRNSNSANQTITFNGLTIGNNYQIQIWASDSAGTAADTGVILSPGTAGATTILYEVVNNGPGQHALGIFTADATSQVITLRRYTGLLTTPVASNQLFVNAVQLREVPIASVDAGTLDGVGVAGFRSCGWHHDLRRHRHPEGRRRQSGPGQAGFPGGQHGQRHDFNQQQHEQCERRGHLHGQVHHRRDGTVHGHG